MMRLAALFARDDVYQDEAGEMGLELWQSSFGAAG